MRETIANLQKEWLAAQPLAAQEDRRLWDKFRLEWNYNSNHIEGNTLTYGETELLLFQGQTTGTHELREYEEMKAHDVAIDHVRELSSSPQLITEADVRNLNKIILKEPFWKPARTEQGEPTRKQIIPGIYKTTPNNVLTATNGLFSFASPVETPAKMQELMEWMTREFQERQLDPVSFAAHFHHRFLLVHPFDDGNGRVARLLSNYILMKNRFPPLVIKSSDKASYLATLRLADAGEFGALVAYFDDQLEWSLQMALKVARGESVEEPSDIEKELALFIRGKDVNRPPVLKRSPAALQQLYKNGLERLITRFETKLSQLTPLFAEYKVTVTSVVGNNAISGTEWRTTLPETFMTKGLRQTNLGFGFQGYKAQAPTPFTIDVTLTLSFEDFQCIVKSEPSVAEIKKLYSEPILSDEIEGFTTEVLKKVFENLKKQAGTE